MGRGSRKERIEPRFDDGDRRDRRANLELHDDDRPAPSRRKQKFDKRGSGSGRSSGRRRKRSLLGRLAYWGFTLGVWGFIGLIGFFAYHAMKLPPIDQIAVPKRPPNIAILASDGTLIANRGETGGSTVTIKELPKYLPQAFVSIEDRRFYSHFGIDPIGISRAMMRNITGGRLSEGGSTLTQQLAKNIFLTQDRTASRKVQEAILALWLERNFSKDQILELYMNRVYFGSGAYGVEAASQKYFGKSARAVTVAEAAILGGLVQAPSRLAPNRNPNAAAERAALVIAAMVRDGAIKDQDAKVALAAPARARRQAGAGSLNYAADWVVDVLDDFIGSVEQDIIVTTTLDPAIQKLAETALTTELEAKGGKQDVSQGAIVAMAVDGGVKALVGGRNYSESQFNRAVAAKRQPGSAFKPFVYLTALERGYTPDSGILDGPINIKGWKPENYTREYFGEVPMHRALAQSLNTPVVRVIQDVGPRSVVRTAQRLGISSPLQALPSLALGTSEVTPLEMTAAYAAFANGGTAVIPYAITQVKTAAGKVIYTRQTRDLGAAMTQEQAGQMNHMLRETLLSGTARKAELPGVPAAGKTGTTQDHKDAWFVGYTGRLVTTVWVGNDDGEEMKKVTGSGLPAEIWQRFMREAHQGQQVVQLPGISWRNVSAPGVPSGLPSSGPILPPANVGPAPQARQPQPSGPRQTAQQPVGAEPDVSPTRFNQQNAPASGGPSRDERNLLQRLLGG
jgi:penicillin-binding protein 1A